jgi:hypothetical protein
LQEDLDADPLDAEAEALPEQRILEQQPAEVVEPGEAVVPRFGDVVVLQAVVDDAGHRVDEKAEHRDHGGGDQQVGGPGGAAWTAAYPGIRRSDCHAGNSFRFGVTGCNRLHETLLTSPRNVKGSIW